LLQQRPQTGDLHPVVALDPGGVVPGVDLVHHLRDLRVVVRVTGVGGVSDLPLPAAVLLPVLPVHRVVVVHPHDSPHHLFDSNQYSVPPADVSAQISPSLIALSAYHFSKSSAVGVPPTKARVVPVSSACSSARVRQSLTVSPRQEFRTSISRSGLNSSSSFSVRGSEEHTSELQSREKLV